MLCLSEKYISPSLNLEAAIAILLGTLSLIALRAREQATADLAEGKKKAYQSRDLAMHDFSSFVLTDLRSAIPHNIRVALRRQNNGTEEKCQQDADTSYIDTRSVWRRRRSV